LAEQAEPALKGADQASWLQRLEDDHDNLRKSLDWFFDHDEPELAVRLAGTLWIFWYMHGHVTEARRWLRRALDACPDEPSESRAKVLDGAGYLANEQGDRDEAISLLEASLSDAKRVGATSAAAIAGAHICGVLTFSDPRAATAAGKEAVALARGAGDDYVLAITLNNLGGATMSLGENEQAAAYIEESLALRRQIGDVSRIALSLCNVAATALLKGDIARAAALFAEAAEIATAIGDKRHISYAHSGLAWVAYRQLHWEEADAHARESLRLGRELGMKTLVVEEICCLAGTAAARGDPARAARLAAVAELHQSLLGPEEAPFAELHRADVEGAKAACDPETWERAWSAGTAMSLGEAAEYALSSA
jgi:non-specific serine/threonine protein kinase